MTDDDLLTYPGFYVGFLVSPQHDPDKLDIAVAQIKRAVAESAEQHLPPGCLVDLQDYV